MVGHPLEGLDHRVTLFLLPPIVYKVINPKVVVSESTKKSYVCVEQGIIELN